MALVLFRDIINDAGYGRKPLAQGYRTTTIVKPLVAGLTLPAGSVVAVTVNMRVPSFNPVVGVKPTRRPRQPR